MCTRRQAIKYIVTDKRGSIEALRSKIGGFYDSFVMLGLIEEILPDPETERSDSEVWIATDIAMENAVLFGIEI